jgi:hypothetical protein
LPARNISSGASHASKPAGSAGDEADTVDEALSDFDFDPLDDALLEGLALALV